MITGLDHVQLALPAGSEPQMIAFYCDLLGLPQIAKPAALQDRGGFWVQAGPLQVHFGVDPDFTPAKKAHPAFRAAQLEDLAHRLAQAGHSVAWDRSLRDVKRCFVTDPVGNRVELMAV